MFVQDPIFPIDSFHSNINQGKIISEEDVYAIPVDSYV